MTVRYQTKVETATFSALPKLLLRWKGSVYKLCYRELLLFSVLYIIISFIYRLGLNPEQRTIFEKFCIYIDETMNFVPLTFVLTFYVSFIISRWWEQLTAYPWPDRMCYLIIHYINGLDERSYMFRRQLIRYISAATIILNRPFSTLTRKRFPTMQSIVDAGILTRGEYSNSTCATWYDIIVGPLFFQSIEELVLFDDIKELKEQDKHWIPCVWFTRILDQCRQEGLMCDPGGMGSKIILDELNTFRSLLIKNWMFSWVTIPVSYTQMVTLATYTFFIGCLFARQPLDTTKNYKGHGFDVYVPIFTVFQFIFYVGWLKVAEQLLNPWGEDDDDFDINWFMERHMQVHFTVTDQMFSQPPPLLKDRYWNYTKVQLPPVNKNREALKPTDCVPAEYTDSIGRKCEWPAMQPGVRLRPFVPKPLDTTTSCMTANASATNSAKPGASKESSPNVLPRQLVWDGSPPFPPGHTWHLK